MKIKRIWLFWLLILMLVLTSCQDRDTVFISSENIIEEETVTSELATESETISVEQRVIMIHICGAVNNPGVYTLEEGCRVIDALKAAGGFSDNACQDYVNLAQNLTDGCKITIPSNDQISQKNELTKEEQSDFKVITNQEGSFNDNLVNINTADEQALLSLTGIGKVRAQSIITYRNEHGPFQTIEDIMKVSGIKQTSFDKFKDEITVN